MQQRSIVPFSAALLAGALAACPAFAQVQKPDPSTQTATKSESPSGAGMYAGVKIDHGPGVIPNDAPRGPAGLAVNAAPRPAAASPAWRSKQYAYGNGYHGEDEGGSDVSAGSGPTPAAYGYGYGYEPAWGASVEPGYASDYGDRCYQRRVMIDQRHFAWRRFCE